MKLEKVTLYLLFLATFLIAPALLQAQSGKNTETMNPSFDSTTLWELMLEADPTDYRLPSMETLQAWLLERIIEHLLVLVGSRANPRRSGRLVIETFEPATGAFRTVSIAFSSPYLDTAWQEVSPMVFILQWKDEYGIIHEYEIRCEIIPDAEGVAIPEPHQEGIVEDDIPPEIPLDTDPPPQPTPPPEP